jgi:hypothetical protein
MPKRRKTSKAMWINPHSNIKGRPIEWDRRQTDVNNAHFLELAEIALKPDKAKSKSTAVAQPAASASPLPKR